MNWVQNFHKRLNFTSETIALCLPELLHFGLVFVWIQFGFGYLAHILFGDQYEDYSTPLDALTSVAIFTIAGDYSHQATLMHDRFEFQVRFDPSFVCVWFPF